MDFSPIPLDHDTLGFWKDVRAFFDEHVTAEVLAEEAATGSGFNEGLHLAMAQRGWVVPDWPVSEGGAGLDRLRRRLCELEMRRSRAPGILRSTTALTLGTIRRHAHPDVRDDVLKGVAAGHVRICLGYTEPDTGSDLAAVKTRARRDGDEWCIDGQKMFTTGAQHSQYCFLLARTNHDVPKHKGLTVFLVPLHVDGIEITPVATLGGERTNFVFYDGVRLDDRFRIGDVDDGWNVVHGALDAEHGLGAADADAEGVGDGGDGGGGMHYELHTAVLLQAVEEWCATGDPGAPSLQDPLVRRRLANAALHIELSMATPSPHCRIASSESFIAAASDLLDLIGPAGMLKAGVPGAVIGGVAEHAYRFAPGTAIYGGTTEVFRNIVAERFLGLPRSSPRAG